MTEKSHCVSALCGEQHFMDLTLLGMDIIKLVTTVASETRTLSCTLMLLHYLHYGRMVS